LIVQNFEEIDFERALTVTKLLVNLEQRMQKRLINNQSNGVAARAKQIMSLAGLAPNSSCENQIRNSSMCSIVYVENPLS